ncbi:hypothetical protein L3X38_008669 [Prunus dulcis]|uniref:Fe2OG dioxygenase domain-containing protein n=1 Tax=Prunus dulcis TaxID=3755 RepID=A0AAD5F780_PRUDU|nr:hypothetical protein L3X38_008669 [Prunus dulcis]
MASSPSVLLSSPPPTAKDGSRFIDSNYLQKQSHVPANFKWPEEDAASAQEELNAPVVDLEGFFNGDVVATENAAKLIRSSCLRHGFFQVTNHRVDADLIQLAYDHVDDFFNLPIEEKIKVQRRPGSPYGYSGAHMDRFSSNLPWKETFSFAFQDGPEKTVADYFKFTISKDFEQTGLVYQKYSEAMHSLSLSIMELLAIGLGVDRMLYREFFEDAVSIMRTNLYPTCQEPNLSLGTGPHCDPNALTILHQDLVGGLDVFVDNKWHKVRPVLGALVINIGDVFAALSNGIYRSCLHRAAVNSHKERRSLVFFMCPRADKVVKPAEELVRKGEGGTRKFPDFTWSDLLEFTQNHYRVNETTLENFTDWFLSADRSNFKPTHFKPTH